MMSSLFICWGSFLFWFNCIVLLCSVLVSTYYGGGCGAAHSQAICLVVVWLAVLASSLGREFSRQKGRANLQGEFGLPFLCRGCVSV